MMLNTELKILAKILANCSQVVLDRLVSTEQAVKGLTIQHRLHLVCAIIDEEAVLINLHQSKAFKRIDHCFLEAVLSMAGFEPDFALGFDSCIQAHAMVEVNGERLKPFCLFRYIHQGLTSLAFALCACTEDFPVQGEGEPSPLWDHANWYHHLGQVHHLCYEIDEVEGEIWTYKTVK